MKKLITILIIGIALSGCVNSNITKEKDESRSELTTYKNDLGIKYNHPDIKLGKDLHREELNKTLKEFFSNPLNENTCKSGEPSKKVKLFHREWQQNPNEDILLGVSDSGQFAIVCGQKYIIINYSPAGQFYYGPFDLKQTIKLKGKITDVDNS